MVTKLFQEFISQIIEYFNKLLSTRHYTSFKLAVLILIMFLLKLSFIVTVSFVLIFFHSGNGQFPAACTDNANNGIKVCCPSACSGRDHGTCESITTSADWSSIQEPGQTFVKKVKEAGVDSGKIDTRYQWPTEVFTSVCVCRGNYAGPDCSECDFGYEMDSNGNCQKRSSLRERKALRRCLHRKGWMLLGF